MTTGRRARPSVCPMPLPPPGTMGPPAEYDAWRRGSPLTRVRLPFGEDAWFATRYGDVRALLADPRLTRPEVTAWPERPGGCPAGPGLTTMMELEGPRHTALRKAVATAFSARSVRAWRPRIRALADTALDGLAADGPPGDLVARFAEPFPLMVSCAVTGIPYADREHYLAPADAALGAMITLDEGRAATGTLRAYLLDLIERTRHAPTGGVLDELVALRDAGGLDTEDVIAFGLSVLVAGYRTGTMFLADAVLALLTRPEQWAALRGDPALLPGAVEELLRFLPVMNANVLLLATEDIEVAGTEVREGEAVIPSIAAANLDPDAFDRPGELDVRRPPAAHLSFGRGAHNCIGAHLARSELELGLAALIERFPGLALDADPAELPWEDDAPAKSPLTLPVRW